MKKISILILALGITFGAGAQEVKKKFQQKATKEIRELMVRQEKCWNEGDLECFMESYWKSDELVFIGKSGPKYGWETTLSNYRKSYPDKKAMGKLQFSLISTDILSDEAAFVIGKWLLEREQGNLSGHFTLLWKKIDQEWVIVADHSS